MSNSQAMKSHHSKQL